MKSFLFFNAFFFSFALQGDVIELAVGIIIGAAFSNVVKSLVEDVLTPPFGLLLGGVDFSQLIISMDNFIYKDQPAVVIRYGKFLQEIVYLLIMGLVLFFLLKLINRLRNIALKKKLEEESNQRKDLTDEVKILLEIRNILLLQARSFDEIYL